MLSTPNRKSSPLSKASKSYAAVEDDDVICLTPRKQTSIMKYFSSVKQSSHSNVISKKIADNLATPCSSSATSVHVSTPEAGTIDEGFLKNIKREKQEYVEQNVSLKCENVIQENSTGFICEGCGVYANENEETNEQSRPNIKSEEHLKPRKLMFDEYDEPVKSENNFQKNGDTFPENTDKLTLNVDNSEQDAGNDISDPVSELDENDSLYSDSTEEFVIGSSKQNPNSNDECYSPEQKFEDQQNSDASTEEESSPKSLQSQKNSDASTQLFDPNFPVEDGSSFYSLSPNIPDVTKKSDSSLQTLDSEAKCTNLADSFLSDGSDLTDEFVSVSSELLNQEDMKLSSQSKETPIILSSTSNDCNVESDDSFEIPVVSQTSEIGNLDKSASCSSWNDDDDMPSLAAIFSGPSEANASPDAKVVSNQPVCVKKKANDAKLNFDTLVEEVNKEQEICNMYKTFFDADKKNTNLNETKANEEIRIDDKSISELLQKEDVKFSTAKNRIQGVPPGLSIFNPVGAYKLFGSSQDILLNECGFGDVLHTSPIEQKLLSVPLSILPDIIAGGGIRNFPFSVPNARAVLLYMLKVLSVENSFDIYHGFKREHRSVYAGSGVHGSDTKLSLCPSLDAILLIFCNCGIGLHDHCPIFDRFSAVHKTFMETMNNRASDNKENNSFARPVKSEFPAETETSGIVRVVEFLTDLLRECCSFGTPDLVDLVLFACWLGLDFRLFPDGNMLVLKNCIMESLDRIPEVYWMEKLEQMATTLSSLGNHHRNILHVTNLLPLTERGLQLQKAVCFLSLQRSLNAENITYEPEVSPEAVFEFLIAHPIPKEMDLYLLHSVITFVDFSVGSDMLAEHKETLGNLCKVIGNIIPQIAETPDCLEGTYAKNKIYYLKGKWTIFASLLPSEKNTLFKTSGNDSLPVEDVQTLSDSDSVAEDFEMEIT